MQKNKRKGEFENNKAFVAVTSHKDTEPFGYELTFKLMPGANKNTRESAKFIHPDTFKESRTPPSNSEGKSPRSDSLPNSEIAKGDGTNLHPNDLDENPKHKTARKSRGFKTF